MSNGALLGLFLVLISVVMYVTGMYAEGKTWPMIIYYVLFPIAIGYFIYNYREKNNGFLSLVEALKTGVGIAVVSALVYAVYFVLFAYVIEPDYQVQMLEATREKMLEQNPNMTEKELEMGLSMVEKFSGPFIGSAFFTIASAFFGFVYSLISGLIFKREQPVQY